MPAHVWRSDGSEFNADDRVLLDWAVLSTALCREAAEWTQAGDGDQGRVHALYLFLTQFLRDNQLLPTSMFAYEQPVSEHLQARKWDSSADHAHMDEIRRAAPVVAAFRGLLSADSGNEYELDLDALAQRTRAWIDSNEVSIESFTPESEPIPPCELCAVLLTGRERPAEITVTDRATSFRSHDMYFSATTEHCSRCGRTWLQGYYEVDINPIAEWGERHFVRAELSTLDLYRIAASDGQHSLELTEFEARKARPTETAADTKNATRTTVAEGGPTMNDDVPTTEARHPDNWRSPNADRWSEKRDHSWASDPNDPRNAVEPPLDEMRARVLIARGILTVDDVITMIENGDVIVPLAEPYVQPETWDEIAERAEGGTPFGSLVHLGDPEGRLRAAYLKKVVENGLAAAAADRAAAGGAPAEETVEVTEDLEMPPPVDTPPTSEPPPT